MNPFGVMYNPASILHSREMFRGASPCGCLYAGYQPCVYPEGDGRDSGQLLKRPQRLFEERELSVDECAGYLQKGYQSAEIADRSIR